MLGGHKIVSFKNFQIHMQKSSKNDPPKQVFNKLICIYAVLSVKSPSNFVVYKLQAVTK